MQDKVMLTVQDVRQETADTVSIYFDVTDAHKENYSYLAGQYVSVVADINGEEVRRSYSICTAPHEGKLAIGVKRVSGGKMSNYLNDTIKKGSTLEVHKPEGRFLVESDGNKKREHYFVATGSGITPVIAMIKDILENEARSKCYLYYGSRDEESIIFKEELDRLSQLYANQLEVLHTLSNPKKVKAKGIKGILGMKEPTWKGEVGRIDVPKFINFLELHPPLFKEQHYYFCGAGEMVAMCKRILEERDVDKKHIHLEYFTTPKSDNSLVSQNVQEAQLTAYIDDEKYEVVVPPKKTVLDALLDQGIKAPYSCTSGACSSCIAMVEKGSVEMEVRLALDDDEIEEGYILACQSHATSKELTIRFNELAG